MYIMGDRKVELKNRGELVEFVKNHKYVIVKVGASWCGPIACRNCI